MQMSEQVSDAMFEQLVAACQEAYEKVSTDRRWMPDPGEYDCIFKDLKTGVAETKDAAKTKYLYLVPVFEIAEGQLAGETFEGEFYSNRDTRAFGRLKGFIETMIGEPSTVLRDDLETVKGMTGRAMVRVVVKNRQYKDKNTNEIKTATNVYVNEVYADAG